VLNIPGFNQKEEDMKRLAAVILCGLVGQAVLAGTNSPCVIAMSDSRSVAVLIRQQADFVAVPITISSEQKDPAMRFEEIRQARDTILQKAKENPRLRVQSEPVSVSARPVGRMSFFSSVSSVAVQPASVFDAQVYVLVPLQKSQGDVYAAAAEADRFVTDLQVRGKAKLALGLVQLAVDNPEQHRPKLLQSIAQDIKTLKEMLGGKAKVTIEGLQAPVVVRQVDDSNVEIFIPYGISIEMQE
jgi:hypothetical protein